VFARAKTGTPIVIVQTRWHEDDLIGRLCDPDHPERDKKYAGIADHWTYINIPAVVKEGDLAKALTLKPEKQTDPLVIKQFGHEPICSLWEGRKSLRHLAEARRLDAPAFDALYMGKPSPDDGDYFKADNLVVHAAPSEYPPKSELRFYAASDHALGEKQTNDYNVMGCFGVDKQNEIWIMPDLYWDRCDTGELVDEMIALMKRHEPQVWFAEDEHINKSIGPFRRKRMREEEVFKTSIVGLTSATDLKSRARSIQGRTTQHMVHFPGWAPWWSRARAELLKFPKATHDDFVSFLSLIGRGLDNEIPAEEEKPLEKVVRVGSIEWVKAAAKRRATNDNRRKMGALG
jgi:predicted phage terminase large subunit-like protein